MYRYKQKKGKKKERSRNFSLFSCPSQCSAFLYNITVLSNPAHYGLGCFLASCTDLDILILIYFSIGRYKNDFSRQTVLVANSVSVCK